MEKCEPFIMFYLLNIRYFLQESLLNVIEEEN